MAKKQASGKQKRKVYHQCLKCGVHFITFKLNDGTFSEYCTNHYDKSKKIR